MDLKKWFPLLLIIIILFLLSGCVKKDTEILDEIDKKLKKIEEDTEEQTSQVPSVDFNKETTITTKTIIIPDVHQEPTISIENIKSHVEKLSIDIGKRIEGTVGEQKAKEYIVDTLHSFGYKVREQIFPLPNGLSSSNLISETILSDVHDISFDVIILGAHYDTKFDSPGANDNGTGVGILLELARYLKEKNLSKKIRLIFFGAEEMIDKNEDHHHYGSRYYVKNLPENDLKNISAMISIDMVGYGTSFNVRTMGIGTSSLYKELLLIADKAKISLTYKKSGDWSDHEPFEKAGIPSAWLQWRSDPSTHSSKDTFDHIQWDKVETTIKLLTEYISSLSN
jgi:hypothetical protein